MIRTAIKYPGHILFTALLFCLLHSSTLYARKTSVSIQVDSGSTSIQLQHENIFDGSLEILKVKPDIIVIDTIDYSNGIIRFENMTQQDVRLEISYEYLGYEMPDYFYKRILDLNVGRDTLVSRPQDADEITPINKEPSAAKFLLSGSKSLSVSAGNASDFDLQQTLQLQIRGQPVEGLTVTGSVTDRATPQAAGISSALEDIETISIKLESQNFHGAVGDLDYRNNWGGITTFSKRLKGVDADLELGRFSGRATVTGLKGRFKSLSFFGRDGISGPYSLQSGTGSRVAVVGGSEKVYLDGRLLTRGASEDYIIDYALGEITFNPRISITSRSRIAVDYEYVEQSYRRNFYAVEMGASLIPGALNISAGFLQQIDSKENPVNTIIGDNEQQILSSAGDNQEQAIRDGADFVGPGKGRYEIETDTSGNQFYRFVGDSLGSYNVTFSRVEQGQGDYIYTGNGIYVYRGPNNGNYLPFQFLPLPQRTNAVFFRTDGKIGKAANFDLKLSGSDYDQNLFSSFEDGNNSGFLGEGYLSFIPVDSSSGGLLKSAQTQIRAWSRERQYNIPGRSDRLELNRLWALPVDSISKRADQLQFNQSLEFDKYVSIDAGYGLYRDADYLSANKNTLAIELRPDERLNLKYLRNDRISESDDGLFSGRIYENRLEAFYKSGRLGIRSGWEDESDLRPGSPDTLNGIRFDRYFAGLDYGGFNAHFARKFQSRYDLIWIDDYRDYIAGTGISTSLFQNHLHLKSELTRRYIDYDDPARNDFSENKTLIRLNFNLLERLISGSVSYRLSRQLFSDLARNFIRVEDGQGDYRLEDSIYVRDPHGDYIAIDELVENRGAGLSSDKSLNLQIDLLKILPAQKTFSRIDLETTFNLQERGDNSYRLNGFYAWPFWSVYPDERRFYQKDLRQTLTAVTANGTVVTLGFEEVNLIDNLRDLKGDRYRRLIFEKLTFRPVTGTLLRLEHRFKKERESSGYFGNADFVENDIQAELQIVPGKIFDIKIAPRYLHDRSDSDDLTVNMYGGEIEPSLSITEKGRISASFSYFNVSEANDRFIPYQFAAGNRPGDNYEWEIGFNLKYNKNITARLLYSADKIPGLKTRHRATASMRASF